MITTLHKTILSLISALVLLLPTMAFAATPVVTPSSEPLFEATLLVPGTTISASLDVSNDTDMSQVTYLASDNESSTGLAEGMLFEVSVGSTTYFYGYFSDFFTAGPVELPTIGADENILIDLVATLPADASEDLQGTGMAFDILIGFEDGETTTVTGTGGGGGGGGTSQLRVYNEDVEVSGGVGGAFVTWETNRSATSYLVCGNIEDGPFVVNDNPSDYFGYDFDISESAQTVREHGVSIDDLAPGTYECRPASRRVNEDRYTLGDPVFFTILPEGEVAGISTSEPTGTWYGETAHADEGLVAGTATSTEDEEVAGATITRDIAKTINELPAEYRWLVLLVVISFLWSLIEDASRLKQRAYRTFFTRNALFTIVYVIALWTIYALGGIEKLWPLFVIAWVLMTTYDYRRHAGTLFNWDESQRHIFYAVMSGIFTISSLLWALPVVTWPFAIICVVSIFMFVRKGSAELPL